MCFAIAALGLTAAETASVGATVATTATTLAAQSEQAHASAAAIQGQETLQQNQISQQAGQQDTIASQQARAAAGQSIVAAGAAGINTSSNSFLASLQTTTMNASTEENLINYNEQNSQEESTSQANSALASKASSPTFLGAGLDMALSGEGAYIKSSGAYNQGANSGRGLGYSSDSDGYLVS